MDAKLNGDKKPPVVLYITPECGDLPTHLNPVELQFNSKVAGLGNVGPIVYAGLKELGVDIRIIAPNMKRMFMKNNSIDENQWNDYRNRQSIGDLIFVNSDHIKGLSDIYTDDCYGGVARTAALFQKYTRDIISTLKHEHEAVVPITNDWMAGGLIAAYLKTRNMPFLHMMHSVHTWDIPRNEYFDTNVLEFGDHIEWSRHQYDHIESHLTAIIDAEKVGLVGHSYLNEIVNSDLDHKIAPHIKEGIITKYELGDALALPNGLYENHLPETQEVFAQFKGSMQFGPESDISKAKQTNKLVFQNYTGLDNNPDAKLFFWPSRFESHQKGAYLIERSIDDIFSIDPEIQVAIISKRPSGGEDQASYDHLVNRANSDLSGRLLMSGFSEPLSDLAYSAADAVFAAQSYEPFGYWIAQAIAAGTLVVACPNGGALDMVKECDGINGNGFFVNQQNSFELVDAMTRANNVISSLNYESRNVLLSNMMQTARAEYGHKATAKGYLNVMEEMTGKTLTQ
jgi:starch synthase